MSRTLTFLDSGVLIAAARGQDSLATRAFQIIDDASRTFASSDYVRLELLPKPTHYKLDAEAEFYREFFASVDRWATSSDALTTSAFGRACQFGLAAMDALHVAAAEVLGAAELVTSEKKDKPLHRVTTVPIVSISI